MRALPASPTLAHAAPCQLPPYLSPGPKCSRAAMSGESRAQRYHDDQYPTTPPGSDAAISTGAGECSPKERYPLWEVPLWTVADAAGKPLDTMDPPGDAFKLYTREVPRGRVGQERKAGGQLARRLAGNRAPLGLFFHAGMESQPDRVAQLRRFIAAAAATRDVWFVTTQQLLRWMAAPAAAGRLRAAGLGCKRPTDIKGRACATYVSDCVFGSWEARRCRCACLGEGSPGGYCSNRRTEQCTEAC
ncbi:hypothetical protein CHLNCDRAFT_59244 [Chlorella variabilis]|uniref:Uncharacterized protein n=1 Tax=Chlorella variabilis TaxID=554065 RepID=E1ZRX7_CHLVA|nr:hypothetical protein CHLNCDRAFT_59244 [Chlorella variabilis]EFN51415.1 hypothetical protein CHLNCDRAFT_59244 [Chlorella variabilis]|eukprot:XP_005843517.1 hypothetical protein CHLNCDRAFT_59244 [Chlorella variabilis]